MTLDPRIAALENAIKSFRIGLSVTFRLLPGDDSPVRPPG